MNGATMGHHTSTHCTLARYPALVRSVQFASYSFGPTRYCRSSILPSSRTIVAVSPSFVRALQMLTTFVFGE